MDLADFNDWTHLVMQRGGRALMSQRALDALGKRCAAGAAICLAGDDGLVVVAPKLLGGTMHAVVLLAVSSGPLGAFSRQEAEMLQVARELGARSLSFHTQRRGWRRLLGPQWRFDGTMYSRGVP